MSYRRSYSERIAVHYSGNVSYPASQNGGSVSYSGTAYEDVNVNIDVDTAPFDRSVQNCNSKVNTLTGAVVATEAAQIASKAANSHKVAETIVHGFFSYIRSELSQQISELKQRADALYIDLLKKAESCKAIQGQMEGDYNDTSSRYMKTFKTLNNELENRIFELDKPAFEFKRNIDRHASRTSDNDMVNTVTVFGLEGGTLQAQISVSIAKKRALDAIHQARVFLWKQKKLDATIKECMLNDNTSGDKYSPVCFIETNNEQNQIRKNIYQSDLLPKTNPNIIVEKFNSQRWTDTSRENRESIARYFGSELSKAYFSDNPHNNRVKETILKFFDHHSIKSIQ